MLTVKKVTRIKKKQYILQNWRFSDHTSILFCTRSSNLSVGVAPIRSLTIERVLLLDAHWR